jgi:hypothetical protein
MFFMVNRVLSSAAVDDEAGTVIKERAGRTERV